VEIYERYWERMYKYIFNRLKSHDMAFELSQDVFLSLLEREKKIEFHTSLSGFLFASVRYQIINHIGKEKVRSKYREEFVSFHQASNSNEEVIDLRDLEGAIDRSIKELPIRCQQIFNMSRLQNLSITEIAQQLKISHRTVENQLSAALKHLRISLGEFMVVFWLVILVLL
jgi:RNA polymerase sigma-70 factor (family 1)